MYIISFFLPDIKKIHHAIGSAKNGRMNMATRLSPNDDNNFVSRSRASQELTSKDRVAELSPTLSSSRMVDTKSCSSMGVSNT
jgi:hypothetical protein